MSSPERSMFISHSSSLKAAAIFTSKFIASNTWLKKSIARSSSVSFFLARMIAGFAPIPRNPALPFSTTSYSNLSLVVSSSISAFVTASSTVLAVTVIISILRPPSIFSRAYRCTSAPSWPWKPDCPASDRNCKMLQTPPSAFYCGRSCPLSPCFPHPRVPEAPLNSRLPSR